MMCETPLACPVPAHEGHAPLAHGGAPHTGGALRRFQGAARDSQILGRGRKHDILRGNIQLLADHPDDGKQIGGIVFAGVVRVVGVLLMAESDAGSEKLESEEIS